MDLHVLIMAGGGGTRFWPKSQQACPKQYLKLTGDRSLLQLAFDRAEALTAKDHIWVITGASQADLVREQLPDLPEECLIGEPMGRDTAACIGLGAALIEQQSANSVMLATPADHLIEPVGEFRRLVHAGVTLTNEYPKALFTFGVQPTYASTGYGYIERGKALAERQGLTAYQIASFKEKPDEATAQQYLNAGTYYWNSGIFLWRTDTFLNALQQLQPEIAQAVQTIANSWSQPNCDEVFRQAYESLSKISIDYAVMEKCEQGIVLPASFQWDDLGSWSALERLHPQDADNNTILAQHCGLNTDHCLIVGDTDRFITTVGVHNLIIVQDGDAILIADKNNEAAIKDLVKKIKNKGYEKYL